MSQSNKDLEINLPVYLVIRRGKTTIFIDAYENTKIIDLKKMLQGLTKKSPADFRLLKENPYKLFAQKMNDMQTLNDLGFTSTVSTPQSPGVAALVYRLEGNDFETAVMEPYSNPPELPEVMKIPDNQSNEEGKSS